MGSAELVHGVRHYAEAIADSCIYCGKPHHHQRSMAEACKHCNGSC